MLIARVSRSMLGAVLAAVLALGTLAPTPTRAQEELIGALIVIGAACAASGKCGFGKGKGKGKNKGGGGGGGDAAQLNETQRRWIQEGLAYKGFYHGAIDGAIGGGTRKSIKDYQASIGDKQSGYMSGPQINALAAASVAFVGLPPNDPRLFETDIARDTNQDELLRLQRELNDLGYNAGNPDGKMGGKTRAAITQYKAAEGLPGGPVPTRRLLSRLERTTYVMHGDAVPPAHETPGDAEDLAGDGDQGRALADDMSEEEAEEKVVAAKEALRFAVLSITPGMSRREAEDKALESFSEEATVASATREQFDGVDGLSLGLVASGKSWPNPGAQQIAVLFDEEKPDEGAVAIFRTLVLPPDVTEDDFKAEIIPSLVEAYGVDGRVGDSLYWVGDSEARKRGRVDPATLEACGRYSMKRVSDVAPLEGWSKETGPVMDVDNLRPAEQTCGDVLKVSFKDGTLRFALWNSNLLSEYGAAMDAEKVSKVPEIKF